MASGATFSTSGEEAISRKIQLQLEQTPTPNTEAFEQYYEIAETARQIEDWNVHRVALQFPDELLHDSVPIHHALRARLGPARDLYILADTSYGSCCVDEVAASHVDADAMIHYGHACMSQTSRLRVYYVFGRKYIDIDRCVSSLVEYFNSTHNETSFLPAIILKHSASYSYQASDIVEKLRAQLKPGWKVLYQAVPRQMQPNLSNQSTPVVDPLNPDQTMPAAEPLADSVDPTAPENTYIVWIGTESPTLTKLLMTSAGREVISYDPETGALEPQTHRTNRMLMRRYALVQRARDADVFGILVGTLGVASYLPLLAHLRAALKRAHKKSYTVSVGKLNPAKLANFMEIECWVWVSCSEGMIDSKEFLQPIITPYELEIALNAEPTWSGKYVFDFDALLAAVPTPGGKDDEQTDADQPMFSLVTGKYRHAKRYGSETSGANGADGEETPSALEKRSQDSALAKLSDNAAAHFLQARTYQGLEARVGLDGPSVLEQGRDGIARGYSDDRPALT